MNTENPWQRLSRIAYARMDHLGMKQTDLAAAGGPSPAWVRKLKATTGPPTSRHTRSLRDLSLALGWGPDQARSIVRDDRSTWSEELMADEERGLIEDGTSSVEAPEARPAGLVHRLRDMLRTDPMAGVTEDEWAELLEAIEARVRHSRGDRRAKRPQRKTGS